MDDSPFEQVIDDSTILDQVCCFHKLANSQKNIFDEKNIFFYEFNL